MANSKDVIVDLAEPVLVDYLWRPQLRDAGHELVREAAVNGRADAFFAERRGRGGKAAAIRLMSRIGGERPRAGGELPE